VAHEELVAALEPELVEALVESAPGMEMAWVEQVESVQASVALDCRNQRCSGTP